MAVIEPFLGRRVEIPEDRRYHPKQGLWALREGDELVFGFTEPALVLAGGLSQVEWLAHDGDAVGEGETVLFAVTGKMVYVDAPAAGSILFNPELRERPELAVQAPYGRGWLFRIRLWEATQKVYEKFSDASRYARALRSTEGHRNPDGREGGNTGMCKAVYRGISAGLSGACC